MVNELKLRGYVTPEDFDGSDRERIQKALDVAKKEDICKVVLKGNYRTDGAVVIPCGMHLVLDHAVLEGNLQNEVINNFSFEQDRIYVEGKNGAVFGNIEFCHTNHVVIENLAVDGAVTLRVSENFRIEYVTVSGLLTLGRACQNGILQHLQCDAMLVAGADMGYDIIGREPLIKNIVLRDAQITNGVRLLAAQDAGLMNVQVDDITAQDVGVTVGVADTALPRGQYQNLTFTNIRAPRPVVFCNEYLHAYVK